MLVTSSSHPDNQNYDAHSSLGVGMAPGENHSAKLAWWVTHPVNPSLSPAPPQNFHKKEQSENFRTGLELPLHLKAHQVSFCRQSSVSVLLANIDKTFTSTGPEVWSPKPASNSKYKLVWKHDNLFWDCDSICVEYYSKSQPGLSPGTGIANLQQVRLWWRGCLQCGISLLKPVHSQATATASHLSWNSNICWKKSDSIES